MQSGRLQRACDGKTKQSTTRHPQFGAIGAPSQPEQSYLLLGCCERRTRASAGLLPALSASLCAPSPAALAFVHNAASW